MIYLFFICIPFFFFFFFFFFFNDTATTEIYTLSLHDALPISQIGLSRLSAIDIQGCLSGAEREHDLRDRKSTRLNSSNITISYTVFCLKKKKKNQNISLIKKTKKHKKNTINTNNET